jgi:hypothetical protein
MSHEAIGQLIERWANDPSFREDLRADPCLALQRSGLELGPEEMAALGSLDWSLPDEQLQSRINKSLLPGLLGQLGS